MVEIRRFVTVALAVAIVAGMVLVAVSVFVAPLSVSMSLFTAVNTGLVAACVDARRTVAGRVTKRPVPTSAVEVGVVVVVTGSALIGSQGLFRISPEMFLSTALLVLSTGYAGFHAGLLASRQENWQATEDVNAVGQ